MLCPHCGRSLGSLSKSGEQRIRLSIVLIDPDTQRIHGPCGRCGGDVTLSEGGHLAKGLGRMIKLGIRLSG